LSRLEELADAVGAASPKALTQYAKARRFEEEHGGPDFVHCSMTMEIGFAVNPVSIDDLCRIYACAVECFRDFSFAE
jgi:hypothetical protein